MHRRRLLAALVAMALPLPDASALAAEARILSAARRPDGGFALLAVSASGEVLYEVPLPARGHATVVRPYGPEAVVVARRPGRFAVVFDRRDGTVSALLTAPEGRHFYGHGAFSADGRLFYTTENDYGHGRGILGAWEVHAGWARVGEVSSHGVGPHDLARLPGTDLLVVANGGILTHPASGRAKLNLADMAPSLAVVDPRDGSKRWSGALPRSLHQASIRHLAVRPDRTVGFGMQYEGPEGEVVPLAGIATPDGRLRTLPAPAPLARGWRQYCADVALDRSGRVLAASFPRGGRVGFWSVDDGAFLGTTSVADGAGLAAADDDARFWSSNGLGALRRIGPRPGPGPGPGPEAGSRQSVAWDNHLTAIAAPG